MPVDAGWTFAPIVLLALAAYLGIYVVALAHLARRGRRRGRRRSASSCSGSRASLCLFVALISPIDRLGEQLASTHMVQHLLIADLAPIALTLALTKHILRPVTRRIQRVERAAGPFGHPAFGVVAYVGGDVAVARPGRCTRPRSSTAFVHVLEHLSFAAAGLLYWWHLLSPDPLAAAPRRPRARCSTWRRRRSSSASSASCSRSRPTLLYDFYEAGPASTRWGLSPLDDQRVAGLIMALEQSIVMGIALAYLFVRMLAESEEEDQRAERYGRPA